MSDFKLKINLGDASIELEGEGVLVKEILDDLKVTGLGALAKTNVSKRQENIELDNKSENNNLT